MNAETNSASDAKRALRDIETAQGRTHAYEFYDQAGPIVIAWGVVWLAANCVSYLRPDLANPVWAAGIAFGAAWSVYFGWRGARLRDSAASPQKAMLISLIIAAVIGIGLATDGAVGGLTSRNEANALISLLVALAYVLMGFKRGARMAALGFALVAAILAGWFLMREWFELWMGFAAGGALILGGLWMRKA